MYRSCTHDDSKRIMWFTLQTKSWESWKISKILKSQMSFKNKIRHCDLNKVTNEPCSYICMYTCKNSVAKNVMLQLHLWHNFYNAFSKTIYSLRVCAPLPPVRNSRWSARWCPSNKRLVGPQTWPGQFSSTKIPCPYSDSSSGPSSP
jgi:hypothetical protein